MSYEIRFRKRAAKEYIEAISWYKNRSFQAASDFVSVIQETLDEVEKGPGRFRNSYKHFHEIKTKKFPFSIVYFIDEPKQIIIITSLFHQKRNPKRKFT
ncbi:MAG: type II toxin-antitoxin system RelE/ParE family toxin [Ginsengibacter sp.]